MRHPRALPCEKICLFHFVPIFMSLGTSDSGPIRIHLVRFTIPDAPHQSIEPFGGVFKPISEMRKMPMIELNLMREIFNQIMGGG